MKNQKKNHFHPVTYRVVHITGHTKIWPSAGISPETETGYVRDSQWKWTWTILRCPVQDSDWHNFNITPGSCLESQAESTSTSHKRSLVQCFVHTSTYLLSISATCSSNLVGFFLACSCPVVMFFKNDKTNKCVQQQFWGLGLSCSQMQAFLVFVAATSSDIQMHVFLFCHTLFIFFWRCGC